MANWAVIGHEWAVRQLQMAVAHDAVPHALLITGPENVGKTTLAHALIAALFCKAPAEERPCGLCLACRKLTSGNHPDFMMVAPEEQGGNLKIDQIRAVERFLTLTPNESLHKIALISDFQRATIGAANALLKTLEEPPAYAHLILLAQDADVLLPTIVSRSQQINLRPLTRHSIEQALIQRWQCPPAQAERLARISGGRIGWAVQAALNPESAQRIDEALSTMFTLLKADIPERFEKAQTLSRDASVNLGEVLEYWLAGWRDILLIQTGNASSVTHQKYQTDVTEAVHVIPLPRTIAFIKMLEHAQEALQQNANTQLLIENLFLNLPHLALTAHNT